jgi:benzil reductase ((S)-benzoin forming)
MKYAWITGSSSGLGLSLTKLLLSEGWGVTGISRHQGPEHEAYHHINLDLSAPGAAHTLNFDPGIAEDVLLINNAGTLGEIGWMGTIADESLERGLTLNLVSPAVLINRFLEQTRQVAGRRNILNISSGAAQNAYDGWGMYCSSKAGLDMLGETAALESHLSGDTRTRIFSVAPGILDTPMQALIRASDESGFSHLEKFKTLHREGKLASPDSVARQLMRIVENPDSFEKNRYDIRDL